MQKILIVEEDKKIRKELETFLNKHGFLAKGLEKLQVDNENCFNSVKVSENNENTSFDIDTSEKFYMLIKEKDNRFKYVYKNETGEEISVLLEYL